MGEDLLLGFRQKPANLRDVLTEHGFTVVKELPGRPDVDVAITYFHFFSPRRSRRGVWLYYHDGIDSDTQQTWGEYAPGEQLAATASLTAPFGSNDFDRDMQHVIARYLRDQHNALLYDPQSDQLITD